MANDYLNARSRIKTGDLLVWASKGNLRSRKGIETELTRIGQRSPWTHVGLAWRDNGRVWVMDLTTHGCAPRILSSDLPVFWLPAPQKLSQEALEYAFSRFGKVTYSRWQAVLGFFGWLDIGADLEGECAEFVLEVLRKSDMAPTDKATPQALVDGALRIWGSSLTFLGGEK